MLKYKNKKLIFRIILLVLMDMLIITAAGPLAIYVRYNLFFEPQAIEFIENIFQYLPVNLILTVIVFAVFRLYQGIWKYASASDLVNIILACLVSAVTQTVGMTLMGLRFPRSYPFMYFAVLTAGISIFRFTYRIFAYFRQKQQGLIKEGKTNVDISAPINPDGSPSTPGGTTQPKKRTLTVRSANESQGSVSGGGTFDEGSTQTVRATPKTGFAFDKWSDGSTQNPRTVKLTSDLTLTASFKTATTGGGDQGSGGDQGGGTLGD